MRGYGLAWSDNLPQGTPVYGIASSENRFIRVVAGPGTGKSFAMKRRVARLLEDGIAATKILPVTFTRIAAEDLHRELVGMNVPGCEDLEGTTLHSLALRMLMRNHVLTATGRTPRPLNDFEIKPLEADLAGAHGGIREVRKRIKAYESAWARLQRDDPGYVALPADAAFERDLLPWLAFHRAMLVGEVIPQLYSYLHANPAAQERSEYEHILVDEYQDLNKAEQSVIELLADAADICIVGDDDQSIYSFKHAHPEGVQEWHVDHPGADDSTLADCRRCPTQVVAMANSLISHNVNRPIPRTLQPFAKNGRGDVQIIQYGDLSDEVNGVVDVISTMVSEGIPPGDILVLAQRGVIGTPIYEGLKARDIPVRSYYAEAELDSEDAQMNFALLKLFVDREDRVALRWLLGLTSTTWLAAGYARVRQHCEQTAQTPWQVLEGLESGAIRIPHTNSLVTRFTAVKAAIQELEGIANATGFPSAIDSLFPEGDDHVRDLRTLALEILESVDADDRVAFLRELTSAIAKPEIPAEVQDVRIMSLHKSKGLSSPVTIIAGCVDGLLPKQPDNALPAREQIAQIEEQRRLFYVGITRVKALPADGKVGTLILTYSQRMPVAAAMGSGIDPVGTRFGSARLIASRFIRELGPAAPTPVAG